MLSQQIQVVLDTVEKEEMVLLVWAVAAVVLDMAVMVELAVILI